MILRRIGTSLREQDWLAVAIEFVIVVVGIFVGLQVTQWNEQRQVRERERNYLVHLAEDVATMRAELDGILANAGDRGPGALRTFRALEACDPERASAEDIQRTFATYQNQRIASVVDRTYQEMVSSGALATMESRELSGAIAALFSELYNYERLIPGVRISLPVIDGILWRELDLSYDDGGRPTLAAFDFGAACRSRELRNATWEIYDLIYDWEMTTIRTRESVDRLSSRLDAHLAEIGADPR